MQVSEQRYEVKRRHWCGPLRKALEAGSRVSVLKTFDGEGWMGRPLIRVDDDRCEAEDAEEVARILDAVSRDQPQMLARLGVVCREAQDDDQPPGIGRVATRSCCLAPVLGCLQAAKDWLGHGRPSPSVDDWLPANDAQAEFVRRFWSRAGCIGQFSEEEMKSFASTDVSEVNAWLKEHGFDIQLSPVAPPNFAVASVLMVLVRWLDEGKVTTVTAEDGQSYPAFKIKKGVRVLADPNVHPHPVVRVRTQSYDTVCMAMVDELPDTDFPLVDMVERLRGVERAQGRWKGLVCPMIDYDAKIDISWLCGMTVGGKDWYVDEALQQTRFRMNELGAKVESAAAMSFRSLALEESPHVIDRPFLLWVERQGMPLPVFASVFAEDVWKKPEEL